MRRLIFQLRPGYVSKHLALLNKYYALMNLNRTLPDVREVELDARPVDRHIASFDPAETVEDVRPTVRGKFLYLGDKKLYIRGVTYGGFRPRPNGDEFPDPGVVEYDFLQMRANGINAVRTYVVPPRWLLDAAHRHHIHVMVGIGWEQHVAFLHDRKLRRTIENRIRTAVSSCAGHPAVLCYAIGNEIPSPIVRWHGRRKIENFLRKLYAIAKAEDPSGLVTYVNYPSTEYIQLPFVDLLCFNVFLESKNSLAGYLARLQNIAGNRPLILSEIGLDSIRNGETAQARSLEWQLGTAYASGCAGAFVFSWTDEWYRGGQDVQDWAFGLTTRTRQPKPALAAVKHVFADLPHPPDVRWPRISVVVCIYNGERTIRDTMEGLTQLHYPDFEVIVVNDGSNDATAAIVREYDVKMISIENGGLSNARNVGLRAASGEIVAYIDGDATPDPHWLTYLAQTFMEGDFAAVGGPNIPPPDDGFVADCVANAPGGPVHVLLSDREAEHIPGCNMAFRKTCLEEVGGFDSQFRIAGDDVDLCWRLMDRGWKLGFSPASVVWHHCRDTVKGYWKQQLNYGKAEAMLERKWPEKYNSYGHLSWKGRLYGNGHSKPLFRRWRVYYGVWGSGPFQSIYQPARAGFGWFPLMPEWYLVILLLSILSLLGFVWAPLAFSIPLLAASVGALITCAHSNARHAIERNVRGPGGVRSLILTVGLHLLQPLSRLIGRLRFGLAPWRRRAVAGFTFPRARSFSLWSEEWKPLSGWIASLESAFKQRGAVVSRGGDYDRWELQIRDGTAGAVSVRIVNEDHAAGKQLLRLRCWPHGSRAAVIFAGLFGALAIFAAADGSWAVGSILGAFACLSGMSILRDCGTAMGEVSRVVREMGYR